MAKPPNPPLLHPLVPTNESIFVEMDDPSNTGTLPIHNRQIAWSTLSSTPAYDTSYDTIGSDGSTTIYGLLSGTVYYVWGRISNADGYSPWSARRSTITFDVPDAPTTPVVSRLSPTSVSITFSPNYDGGSSITGFEIGYGTNPSDPTDIISATSPMEITGLTAGLSYYYWVRARNEWGYSEWSNSSSFQNVAGARINVGGVWKNAVPYVKVAGVWRMAQPWSKVLGVWKQTS